MRTKSVDSRLVHILEKAVQAQKHLDEAVEEIASLPESEAKQTRHILEPARNQLRSGVSELRSWVETPPRAAE